MTTNLSDFSLTFLGTIKSRFDVNVNIDVTITTYFWQPSFSKCAFKKKKGFIWLFTIWIIILRYQVIQLKLSQPWPDLFQSFVA